MRTRDAIAVFSVLTGWGCALAQPDPSGIDFVTIGAPGNAPWAGNGTEGDMAVGRGRVDYEYRIGRTEITTSQWVEFFNVAYDRADAPIPHLFPPDHWGAVPTTPNNPGRQRWSVPAGNENLPVGDISWRMAAIYCNWLCNDKSPDRGAFMDGAYDVSTFGWNPIGFSDQLTHNPGARFWVPTWNEWLKAAHYDPNKPNPDGTTGGWWTRPNGTDIPLAYGPPGAHVRITNPPGPDPNGPLAQANAAWSTEFPGFSPFAIPLGSYLSVTSPWGLLDAAGGTSEWTEEVILTNNTWPTARALDGSAWTTNSITDRLAYQAGGDFPNTAVYEYGFRIAAAIPAPSSCIVILACGTLLSGCRSRKGELDEDRRLVRGVGGGVRGLL